MSIKYKLIGAMALAASVIIPFEGKHLIAYLDPPGIPTLCYGHTGGVSLGDTATDEECTALLKKDIEIANAAFNRLVRVDVSDNVRAAFISFIYNAGEGKFAKSTALKKLNAGDIRGACEQLSRWVYAGGKRLNGLVKRRAAERELCLKGV